MLLFKSIQSIFNVLSGVRITLSSYHKMRTLDSKLEKGRMVVVSFGDLYSGISMYILPSLLFISLF